MYEVLARLAAARGPASARALAVWSMRWAGLVASVPPPLPRWPRRVMGLSFPAPLGLAAGFDRDGALSGVLAALGFGFSEIGSVTPRPEAGRSPGLAAITARLARRRAPRAIPLGISLSMNRATPPKDWADDYLQGLRGAWPHADYLAINLGPRAGPDLHLPEQRQRLSQVLTAIQDEQARLSAQSGTRRPIVVKVDRHRADTDDLLACVHDHAFDGLILGGDLRTQADHQTLWADLARAVHRLEGRAVMVGGGLRSSADVARALATGAALAQIYTAVVHHGPWVARRLHAQLRHEPA